MPLNIFPPPKKLRRLPGYCAAGKTGRQIVSVARPETGAYRLSINKSGTRIQAAGEAGLFYAEQTLRQIDRQCPGRRPCLEILDWPDYGVRGFYHDVTRGKVPTLKTLLQLAELCALYKLNHLELYIEHTYAFRNHPEVWAGADPLTADEILALDARCAELHIDLVPSFSTFGHFYTWIHLKFPELNELERDVSQDPFNWLDRMLHHTIDCRNPKSIRLIREIIREVRPLFRSKFFNICADETFDIGTGKNRKLAEKLGKGRLYVDFLKLIMAAVKAEGATPLFWGDVISHYPALLPEIPSDAIALDWDYSSKPNGGGARLIAETGRTFFVCPSVQGHNCWLPDSVTAHRNITRLARIGRKYGAAGLLNTDWGDYGHINTLGPTLPGLILGASAAWAPTSGLLARKKFNEAISRSVYGDSSGRLMSLLDKAAEACRGTWSLFAWNWQPRSPNKLPEWFAPDSGIPYSLNRYSARSHATALGRLNALETRIEKILSKCTTTDPLLIEELRVGLLGMQVMEEWHLFQQHESGRSKRLLCDPVRTATRLRELDRRLAAVWRKRNKPSEYYRISEVLRRAAKKMESHHADSD